MTMKWEVLERNILFKRYFQVDEYIVRHEKFQGGENKIVREVFERGDAVAVIHYDPLRDEVVLIEQFRAGALRAGIERPDDGIGSNPWLFELIAGVFEPGESEEDVVRREAMEEAGCELQAVEKVYQYLVSPGGTSEEVTLYVARVSTEGMGGVFGLDDEHEDIKVHIVKRPEAVEWLKTGKIRNAVAIIGLQWLALNHAELQARWKA